VVVVGRQAGRCGGGGGGGVKGTGRTRVDLGRINADLS